MSSSGVTRLGAGGRVLPYFAELPGKEEQGRKGKWRGKEGKFEWEDVENWKWKGKIEKVCQWAEDHFIFWFFACHFLKPQKFVWGLPKWTIFILPGRSIFHTGKVTLLPRKNIPLSPLKSSMCSTTGDIPYPVEYEPALKFTRLNGWITWAYSFRKKKKKKR